MTWIATETYESFPAKGTTKTEATEKEVFYMVKCDLCGRDVEEKDALKHKNKQGKVEIICPECFEKATGVDYKTFAYRKENAKQTLFALLFCIGATIYAFVENGPLYGGLGIILTILVFFFSAKVK